MTVIVTTKEYETQLFEIDFVPVVGTRFVYEISSIIKLDPKLWDKNTIKLWKKFNKTDWIVTEIVIELRNYNGKHMQNTWVYIEPIKEN